MENSLKQVQCRLERVAEQVGRPVAAIHLLAVSKMQTPESIRQLYQRGQRDFGENYLQEAVDKQQQLADLDIVWHFIGPVQRNKTQEIARSFSWVHSVDRLVVAQRLSAQRPSGMRPLDICIQVNMDGETSKSGCPPQAVAELVAAVIALPQLRLRGLMTLPAPGNTQAFYALTEVLRQLQCTWPQLDSLSMGMSADLEDAVRAGATWVRVGTALFGKRNQREGI